MPNIGLNPKAIPLNLFLDWSLGNNVTFTSRVAWMFSWKVNRRWMGCKCEQNSRHKTGFF